ncbi:dolichol-phosphate mannosyltransferase [Catalinimonas alkaloidigena]|uniref:polyprenol monophosphomannose synthase n=1 Tax=Catalinimonas alkaloidigena TaxID=1075417 RepID=UPI0024049C2C|nr:polyprenol monophosphomannose synthase [Catalinimonas alkaloidigena]MDF9800387.1 dolichol-phosphate mannosyltransferase [Catalinimonas alkaloidigena]
MSTCLVVIPTYNEKENINPLLEDILNQSVLFDVLIVDDNSPDGTAQLVKEKQQKYPGRIHLMEREKKSGLGPAYIAGFKYALHANYLYIFEMDADFSHNPNDLVRLYETCAHDGYDLAIGSRYVSGVNVVNWPMSRVLISFFASIYIQMVTSMPIRDATAGFKCYHRSVLQTIDLDRIRFIGYAFQIEMKFTAWMYDFKIKEVPIIFTNRTKGESKMSTRIFWEAFTGVIYIKIRSFFRKYNR